MSLANVSNYAVFPFSAPSSTGTVLEMKGQLGAGNILRCQVESLEEGGGNDITVEVEEYNPLADTWAGVSGMSGTVKPGGAIAFAGSVAERFRVRASGSAYGRITISSDLPLDNVSQLP